VRLIGRVVFGLSPDVGHFFVPVCAKHWADVSSEAITQRREIEYR
jgi:hypothetical protein